MLQSGTPVMKRPKHIISLYNAFVRAHRYNAESLGLAATKSENLQKETASKEINSHYLLKNIAVRPSETFALSLRNPVIRTRTPAEIQGATHCEGHVTHLKFRVQTRGQVEGNLWRR